MKRTIRIALGCALFIYWALGATLYAQEKTPTPYEGPNEKLHIYLLIGQSNMAGRALYPEQESAIVPRCYLFNGDDKWEPAKNPFNRYSTIRKGLDMQKMNPGYSFSKEMLENNRDVSLGLVVNAKGGTKIEEWAPGTTFYNEALRRTREAQKSGVLKGILWHQGESNSRDPNGYIDKLNNLISHIREDLNEPGLPFVAGQVFYHPEKKPHTKQVNDQIAKLPDVSPFSGYVTSNDLTTHDSTHFDFHGMTILGRRYAEEMLKIQTKLKVEAREVAFAKAFANRDIETFLSFVSPEAVFFNGNEPLRGHDAIANSWAPLFEGETAPFSWHPDVIEVLESGRLAISSGPIKSASGETVGRFNSIWRKEKDGLWRVVFDKGS